MNKLAARGVVIGVSLLGSNAAYADCSLSGKTYTCTGTWNTRLGNGAADNDYTVNMASGHGKTDQTAISLGDRATITIGTQFSPGELPATPGAIVEGNVVRVPFPTGPNVIEFNSFGRLTIGRDAMIFSGGQTYNGEAINAHGYGNIIDNYGIVRSAPESAAIWFEDNATPPTPADRNQLNNYGLIERVGGGDVLGTQAPGTAPGIVFANHSGAVVNGNLNFQSGDDDLIFYPHSVVTGSIDGGAGTNSMELNGEAGSLDSLAGDVRNFQTLTKTGDGRWNLTGSLSTSDFTTVMVKQGVLGLTGNNANYTGRVIVDAGGTLEARAQSLPTNAGNLDNVQNSGLVRFTTADANDSGTYVGQITGAGAVEKIGAGTSVLDPQVAAGNTWSGGLTIRQGTLAITRDEALGAAAGSVAFDNSGYGGIPSLRFDGEVQLSPARPIVINGTAGGIDTNGHDAEIGQGMTGAGALVKQGAGSLTLAGDNQYQGGTVVSAGTLVLGNGGAAGSILGDVLVQGPGTLAFDRSDVRIFPGLIQGEGGVRQQGSGATVLTADNLYTGLTSVSQGTLQIGAGGPAGSIAGPAMIDAGATLAFNRSSDTQWGGNVSGSGNLVQMGPGRLDKIGNSPGFDGNLYVQGGVMGLAGRATALSTANTYVGAGVGNTAGSGVLEVGGGARLSAAGDFSVAPAAGSRGRVVVGASPGNALAAPGAIAAPRLVFGPGDGGLIFNHTSSAYAFDGAGGVQQIVGPGRIDVYAGRTILAGDHSGFSGVTAVQGGALQVNGRLGGSIGTTGGGRLEGNGFVGPASNAGIVAPGASIGKLTVTGDYVGAGGLLETEAVLGDDSSPADLLVITGNSTGATRVAVRNLDGQGGLTTQGIKIVQVDGSSPGVFSLAPDFRTRSGQPAVVAGEYLYGLYQGSPADPADGDWYLRTLRDEPDQEVAYQPGAAVYEAYPQALMALNRLPTLQQRVGNRVWEDRRAGARGNGAPLAPQWIEGQGMWARVEGSTASIKPASSTFGLRDYDMDIWRMQFGFDTLLREYEDGAKVLGGLNAQIGQGRTWVHSDDGNGYIDATGYGLGGTLTWYRPDGVYVDGQAQVMWFDSDLDSGSLGVHEAKGNNGYGFAFSVETGKKMALSETWTTTPQFQLSYSRNRFSSFEDAYGAKVRNEKAQSLLARLGISFDREVDLSGPSAGASAAHADRRWRFYGIANLTYEFLGDSSVSVGHTRFDTRQDRLWGELGFGSSYNWRGDKYSVYGELGARTALANFGDSYGISGTIGFRARF